MIKSALFFNRELSWLAFNERILECTSDTRVPLLERLKFLAITASNLDEFFMVRVGGLQTLVQQSTQRKDPSGLTPAEQLDFVRTRAHQMAQIQEISFQNISKGLVTQGIRRVTADTLTPDQHDHADRVFTNDIYPIVTPIACETTANLPLLTGRMLYLAVKLEVQGAKGVVPRFAVVPLGRTVGRIVVLPGSHGYEYMMVEELAALYIERLFTGQVVKECVPFRITRNADLGVRDDMSSDLLMDMQEIIEERKHSHCVRLEIGDTVSPPTLTFLQKGLRVAKEDIYRMHVPLDLSVFMRFIDLPGHVSFKNPAWPPRQSPQIQPGVSHFDILKKQDILLVHPFESYEPVVRFIEEAADDPSVVAIKQILYRTSRQSPIVAALVRAARQGKYVTALVELKARFDEERNIEWAQQLESEGVQVVYGVRELKTHAKACLVVRKEPQGMRRYIHFGTGNYNEITAQLYTDVSFITANDDLGADASSFFNAITGYSQPQQFRKISAAPLGLREAIIGHIEAEAARQKQGQKAFIRAKMNSLVDPEIIEALYAASQAGVKISLNIRGICCLRPGVKKLSETITVISIVDRLLEHSRIFHFCNGGEDRVFIATADWMPRNLDKRIELMIPIEGAESKQRIIDLLTTCFKDTHNAWRLSGTGAYDRIEPPKGKKPFRSQEASYQNAVLALSQERKRRRTVFIPHTSHKDQK